MSLRLAVWCPQGGANLSFAARLAIEQMPADLMVWRSDDLAPTAPAAVLVDLWLVFCVGAPPPPPVWRRSAPGRWLVFPGPADRWDGATSAAVDLWGDATVLTDRLWEESANPVLRDWWDSRDLVWLPAIVRRGSFGARRREVLIACSADLPEWLGGAGVAAAATAFGARVVGGPNDGRGPSTVLAEIATTAERVLLCSTDPAFSGAVLRLAAETGVAVAVLGTAGAAARAVLFGFRPVESLALPAGGEPIAPTLRSLVPTLRSAGAPRALALRDFHWQDWAQGIGEAAATGGTLGGEVARHRNSSAERRRDPNFRAFASLAERVLPTVPLSSRPSFALEPICFEALSRGVPDPGWFELGARLAELVPGWTEAAIRWATENGDGAIAKLLWVSVCDGYCFASNRSVVAGIAEIYDAAQRRDPTGTRWIADRAVVRAAIGALATAKTDLDFLFREDRAALGPTFLGILRAWIPGLECGEPGVIPPEGGAWWRHELDLYLAAGAPGAGAVRAYGELWMGTPEVAERLLRVACPTPLEAYSFAIVAALNRAPATANRCMSEHGGGAAPESPGLRLTWLCARALCGNTAPEMGDELARIVSSSGTLFDRDWPSHPRCFFSAVILARCGHAAAGALWRDRAEEQDPLARHRRWCYQSS